MEQEFFQLTLLIVLQIRLRFTVSVSWLLTAHATTQVTNRGRDLGLTSHLICR